jgi:hypothetical protein
VLQQRWSIFASTPHTEKEAVLGQPRKNIATGDTALQMSFRLGDQFLRQRTGLEGSELLCVEV